MQNPKTASIVTLTLVFLVGALVGAAVGVHDMAHGKRNSAPELVGRGEGPPCGKFDLVLDGCVVAKQLLDEGAFALLLRCDKYLDEEEHVDHLEGQLHAIQEMGIENYLAQQLHKGEDEKD